MKRLALHAAGEDAVSQIPAERDQLRDPVGIRNKEVVRFQRLHRRPEIGELCLGDVEGVALGRLCSGVDVNAVNRRCEVRLKLDRIDRVAPGHQAHP
jgi:hypothetical protein